MIDALQPPVTPNPSIGVIVMAGFLGLLLAALKPVVNLAVTVAHEGGHAVAGSVMGGKVASITMNRHGGGQTTVGGLGPFGLLFFFLAGYIGPSVFGLIGAIMLAKGRVGTVLWVSVILLALALFQSGNFVARIAIFIVGGIIVLVLRYADPDQQVFFAYTWIWFLLIGGFIDVLWMQQLRRDGTPITDLVKLKAQTFLPASLWSGFYWLATLAALFYGASLLLRLTEFHF